MVEWVKKNLKRIIRFVAFIIVVGALCGEYTKLNKIVPDENAIGEYMLNTNSMKIHIPTCASVTKMSEKNKKLVSAHILDLVSDGYTICFNCYAGLKRRTIVETILDSIIYSNITAEKPEELPTIEEYLDAVDTMCKWYTEHVPTYLTNLQNETIEDYNKLMPYITSDKYKGDFLTDYHLFNKYKSRHETINTYSVISSSSTITKLENLDKNANILKANELAVKYYYDNYSSIRFRKAFAYYPCELIKDSEDDYNMAGDDCVRLIFSALNYMDKGFTKKLKKYSKLNWSKVTSNLIAGEKDVVSYSLQKLGFAVYDTMHRIVDINFDGTVDLDIKEISNDFQLKKGDIIARPGHVHFYLGNGKLINIENFGWGKVNRCYLQISNIYIENSKVKFVNVVTGKSEYYTRIYHYIGKNEE